MRRGTTPTHTFTLPFEVGVIKSIRVIYSQNKIPVLRKDTEDFTLKDSSASIKLTQSETLAFDSHKTVDVQVRVLTKDGEALASQIMTVRPERLLENEVLE